MKRVTRTKELLPAPEDAVLYYITSNVMEIEADENGTPVAPTQSITLTQWKKEGGNAAVQSSERKMRVWKVKNGVQTRLFYPFQGVSCSFAASEVSGYHSVLAELMNGSNIVASLSVPLKWRGKEGTGYKATVYRDAFTESQWNSYCEIGHTESWNNTSDSRNGCRTGDLFNVVGYATDTGNYHNATFRCDNDSGNLHGVCISHQITQNGKSAAHLVLDCYQSTIVVDNEGNLVKTIGANYARFFLGDSPTTPSAWNVSYSPSSHQGWDIMTSASGNVNTLTFRDVQEISDTGLFTVTVTATYEGQTYSARWEIFIERDVETFELVPSPDMLVYNETREVWEVSSVYFGVFKNSGITGRTQLLSLPIGFSLKVECEGEEASLVHRSNSRYWRMDKQTNDSSLYHNVYLGKGNTVYAEKTIQTHVRNEAVPRPREWVTGVPVTYTHGGEGEMYKDVIVYAVNGVTRYYECRRTASNVTFTSDTSPDDYQYRASSTGYFGPFTTNWNFVATDLLLAQLAYIRNLGVNYLQIYGNGGKIEMYDDAAVPNLLFQVYNGNVLANTGTFNNIRIAGKSTFRGVMIKEMVTITASNIDEYATISSGVYEINIEKTGTFIQFDSSSINATIEIKFPSNLKYIGNRVIVSTSNDQVSQDFAVRITGYVSNSTSHALSLQSGEIASFSCELGFSSGHGMAFWFMESVGIYP